MSHGFLLLLPRYTSCDQDDKIGFQGDLPLQEGASDWAEWTPNRPTFQLSSSCLTSASYGVTVMSGIPEYARDI